MEYYDSGLFKENINIQILFLNYIKKIFPNHKMILQRALQIVITNIPTGVGVCDEDNNTKISKKLPEHTTICTVEIITINIAVKVKFA